jgi:hypothetical protein
MGEDVLFDCAWQVTRAAHEAPNDDLERVL